MLNYIMLMNREQFQKMFIEGEDHSTNPRDLFKQSGTTYKFKKAGKELFKKIDEVDHCYIQKNTVTCIE